MIELLNVWKLMLEQRIKIQLFPFLKQHDKYISQPHHIKTIGNHT